MERFAYFLLLLQALEILLIGPAMFILWLYARGQDQEIFERLFQLCFYLGQDALTEEDPPEALLEDDEDEETPSHE